MKRKMLRESGTRRLLEEQLAVVAVLGSGKKSDAMWHVPQRLLDVEPFNPAKPLCPVALSSCSDPNDPVFVGG